MFNCIVCATDGSEHSDKAAELAADLAATYGARLRFVHVYMKGMSVAELERFSQHAHLKDIVAQELDRLSEFITVAAAPHGMVYVPPPLDEVVTRIAEVILEDARLVAVEKDVQDVTVHPLDGKPADQILEFAEREGADAIVLGSRGLGGLRGLVAGSTSQKVNHLAKCTCITVK